MFAPGYKRIGKVYREKFSENHAGGGGLGRGREKFTGSSFSLPAVFLSLAFCPSPPFFRSSAPTESPARTNLILVFGWGLVFRRLEAQRRKERQEAHLYMTVDVS